MASIKPTTVPTKRLAASINAASTTFTLNNIEGWDGANLTSADFGTKAYGVFRDTTNTIIEVFEFDPTTIADASITFVRRGLKFTGDLTTEVTGNKLTWIRNVTQVELGSDAPQLLAHYVDDLSTQTVSGIKTFDETTMPRISAAHTFIAGEEEFLVTKRYADALAIAGAPDASTTQKGLAEEATQAEVDARTAAGSAARLFLNPSTLRAAKYHDFLADTGSANAYVITPSPAIAAYATGQVFGFVPANTNTQDSTLNVNAKGATTIKRFGGVDVGAGDLVAGQPYLVYYNGTHFYLVMPLNSTPSGSIQMYVGSSAPTGWLLCDGTSYLRSGYLPLFGVISTTYGAADGTHFNVPDFRGRAPMGAGTGTGGGTSGTGAPTGGSALTARALGAWLGEETHVLTTPEIPSHTHTIGGSIAIQGGVQDAYSPSQPNTTTGNTGGGGAHQNMSPVMTVNFIIKT